MNTENSSVEIKIALEGDGKDILTLKVDTIEECGDNLYFQDDVYDLVISKKDLVKLANKFTSISFENVGVLRNF